MKTQTKKQQEITNDAPGETRDRTMDRGGGAVLLVVVAALCLAAVLIAAWAQNTVPPTARQAAQMPEFASRLARPAEPQASPKAPTFVGRWLRLSPLQDNVIYTNGPINGNTDAWTINFGFIVSDTFSVNSAGGAANITGMSFGAWVEPGDTLESAQVVISSSENGGATYFNQVVNFAQSGCVVNTYGFNVCTETGSFSTTLSNGTYWVNLQNAVTSLGDPIYWDENSGASSASENGVGTIPSESFTVLGRATTTTSTTTSTGPRSAKSNDLIWYFSTKTPANPDGLLPPGVYLRSTYDLKHNCNPAYGEGDCVAPLEADNLPVQYVLGCHPLCGPYWVSWSPEAAWAYARDPGDQANYVLSNEYAILFYNANSNQVSFQIHWNTTYALATEGEYSTASITRINYMEATWSGLELVPWTPLFADDYDQDGSPPNKAAERQGLLTITIPPWWACGGPTPKRGCGTYLYIQDQVSAWAWYPQ